MSGDLPQTGEGVGVTLRISPPARSTAGPSECKPAPPRPVTNTNLEYGSPGLEIDFVGYVEADTACIIVRILLNYQYLIRQRAFQE